MSEVARSHGANHQAQQGAGAVHSGCIRLARGGHDHFAALLVNPLHDGDRLRSGRSEPERNPPSRTSSTCTTAGL